MRDAIAVLTTGPVPVYPAISRAMGRPIPFDYDPGFQQFYQDLAWKAARAMRCPEPPLILQFEAAPGLEACAASLMGRGDVVLNVVSGVYGASLSALAARHAGEVIELAVPSDQAVTAAQVADALRARPDIGIVSLVHHETPSGTLNPVHAIGAVVREHGALLMIDAVSSFGGMDVDPVACCADVFVASPGKCLGGTPGLTLVAVSARGWAKMDANPASPRISVLSLLDWRMAWQAGQAFPFTPSMAEIFGLDAALDLYLAEGPAAVWARHSATARACRAGVRAMGLTLWPASDVVASPTSTVVRLPDGVDAAALLASARETLGVVFAPGRQPHPTLRIAHMGVTAEPLYAVIALIALAAALQHQGVPCDVGRGVQAALNSIAAIS